MKIKSLKLKNYKKFKDFEIKFEDGLIFILGPNEAGKSTILSAIFDLLFVDASTNSAKKFFPSVVSWGQKSKPVIEGVFEYEGKEYKLIKDFVESTNTLIVDKETITHISEIENKIKEILCIGSREVYEATGFIRQEEISEIRKKDTLISMIQSSIGSNNEEIDVEKKIKNITKELEQYQKGIRGISKTPGEVKFWQDRVTELSDNLKEIRELKANHEEIVKEYQETTEKIESTSQNLNVCKTLVKNSELNIEISKELYEINNKLDQITADKREIEKFKREIRQIEVDQKLIQEKFLDKDPVSSIAKIEELSQESNMYAKQAEILDEERGKSANKNPIPGVLIIIVALVLAILINNFIIRVFASLVGIFGLGLFISFLQVRIRNSQLEKQISNYKELCQIVSGKIMSILDTYEYSSVNQLKTEYERSKSLASTQQNKEELQNAILRGKSLQELEDEELKLLRRKREIEISELTTEIKDAVLSPERLAKLKIENQQNEEKLELLKQKEASLKVKVELSEISNDKFYDIQIELENAERSLSQIEFKVQILEKTKEFIQKAINDRVAIAASILRKYIQNYLGDLTNGKYSKVRFDEKLNLQVFSDIKDDWIEPEKWFSTGTIDLLSLLARISYFDIISKTAPLLMDDPFVSVDETRRAKVFNLLQSLSKDRQIIVFSHNFDYSKYGYSVFLEK